MTAPAGFVVRVSAEAVLIVRKEYEGSRALSDILTGATIPETTGSAILSGGRGAAVSIDLSGIGTVVVRRYRRGGLIGKFLVDRYLSGTRPLRELEVTAFASSCGVPVPGVVGASSIRAGLLWHRGRIVTRQITDSRTLPLFIADNRQDARGVADVLRKAGSAIRRMHEAGINHADLNMNNILVDRRGAVFIIDFDKAAVHPHLGWAARLRNLRRLLRSARKLAESGLSFSDTDFEAILAGYCGTDGPLFEKLKNSTTGAYRTALRSRLSRLIGGFFR